jgi:ATP-dependent helicase Lhr and Lhr-like helicase
VLYVERGGRSLLLLAASEGSVATGRARERIVRALRALAGAVRAGHVQRLALERIDGEPAIGSSWEPLLAELGFRASPRRLELSA